MNIPAIPDFADERVQGIEMMQLAERESVFLRPAASHALTYTWIEESKLQLAESTAVRLSKKYPNNIINLQVLGRVQTYRRKYPASEKEENLEVDPKMSVHYLAGCICVGKRLNLLEAHRHLFDFDCPNFTVDMRWPFRKILRLGQWSDAEKAYCASYKLTKTPQKPWP